MSGKVVTSAGFYGDVFLKPGQIAEVAQEAVAAVAPDTTEQAASGGGAQQAGPAEPVVAKATEKAQAPASAGKADP